jgi:hypothetical protein
MIPKIGEKNKLEINLIGIGNDNCFQMVSICCSEKRKSDL